MRGWLPAALVVSAALAGCGSSGPPTTPVTFSVTTTTPTVTVPAPTATSYIGPEDVPIETGPFLAPPTTTELGSLVDNIQCEPLEQFAYVDYAHLQVFVNGKSYALPGGIGLVGPKANQTANGFFYSPQTCFYWLHTRAADGIIQVKSPVPRKFTLGEFFSIWNQPLNSTNVAGHQGPVSAMVNGKPWTGAPGSIPLTEHAVIQLNVGTPVAATQPFDWTGTGL